MGKISTDFKLSDNFIEKYMNINKFKNNNVLITIFSKIFIII